jgi:hypothetical protein
MRASFAALLVMIVGAAQGAAPLHFVDAHSHLLPNMTVDEEMAMLRDRRSR